MKIPFVVRLRADFIPTVVFFPGGRTIGYEWEMYEREF